MSDKRDDEHASQDDHGHPVEPDHNEPAPADAHPVEAEHAPSTVEAVSEGGEHAEADAAPEASPHEDHPAEDAVAHDESGPVEAVSDGHDHGAHDHEPVADEHEPAAHTPDAGVVAGTAAAAAATSSDKRPIWSDQGDAPFDDEPAPTPRYARTKKERKVREKSAKSAGGEFFEILKTIFFAMLIAFVLRVLLFQPFTIPSASMEPNLYEGDYIVVSKWSYGYSKHAIPFSPPVFEGRIFAQEPRRGDIVVFKLPRDNRTDYIKRLIGLPGDRVQMINNVLHINGEPVRDVVISQADAQNMYGMPIIKARETLPGGKTFTIQDYGPGNEADDTRVFEVPEGYYFMMGDNRDNSVDSRFDESANGVGLVPAENLIGKAEIILFSWKPGASLWNPVSWFSKVQPSRFFTDLD